MVDHLRLAVHLVVHRDSVVCYDVALELVASRHIRDKNDNFLAGSRIADTFEDLVWRVSS